MPANVYQFRSHGGLLHLAHAEPQPALQGGSVPDYGQALNFA